MKILVTGCNGFIGSKLVKQLLNGGYQVLGFDLKTLSGTQDIKHVNYSFLQVDLDRDHLPNLVELSIDVVIHLAIAVRPGRVRNIDSLLVGTNRLLNAVEDAKVPIFIGMSSLSVLNFSRVRAMSVIDETIERCNDLARMGCYAALKSKQEELFFDFANRVKFTKLLIVRPGLVYQKPNISNAYAGIVKSKGAIVINHDGYIPLIEIDSLIDGLHCLFKNAAKFSSKSIFHFVDDGLPDSDAYLNYLGEVGFLPNLTIKVNWKFANMIINAIFWISSILGVEKYLPDLLKPQSFSTRSKPFKYSNAKAKKSLAWNPINADL